MPAWITPLLVAVWPAADLGLALEHHELAPGPPPRQLTCHRQPEDPATDDRHVALARAAPGTQPACF